MRNARSGSAPRSAGRLALSTLAYGVVGLTLMGSARLECRRKEALDVDCRRLSRDQGWFLIIFVCKLALGLVAFPGSPGSASSSSPPTRSMS